MATEILAGGKLLFVGRCPGFCVNGHSAEMVQEIMRPIPISYDSSGRMVLLLDFGIMYL